MLVLLKILVAALVCARWLVPAEGAAEGTTLWITQLWPAVLGIWAWYALRRPAVRIRWGRSDVMLALVVLGHLVSALSVVFGEGQKRAAVNMLWEWIGLGIGFFLLRQLIVTHVDRDRLLLAFVAVIVSLSGLGIWQHFVFYPQTRLRYVQARSRLDGLLSGDASSGSPRSVERQRRIRQARNELLQMGVPSDALSGRMRRAFEGRLEASREPFGPFALANTFAGFLAVGLILLIAAGSKLWRATRGTFVKQAVLMAAIALVAFCLLLTKSRTAWVGTVCGLGVWMFVGLRGREFSTNDDGHPRRTLRRGWLIPLGGGVLLGGLLIGAVLSGGLDLAVLSEAPKSLKYRLEYWTGSWAVVRERPWLGVGPGNFRQHYLRYKLPGSSEEIADPHDWLLGIWTSGGLMAVCGFIGLLVAWAVALRQAPQRADKVRSESASRPSPWLWGTAFGFVLVLVFRAVLEDRFDVGLTSLLVGWLMGVAVFRKRSNRFSVSSVGIGAAVLAVMVHLLGAGGIEMPAVVQSVLLLMAAGLWDTDRSLSKTGETSDHRPAGSCAVRLAAGGVGIFAVLVFVLCLLTATRPVMERRAWVLLGDNAISERNDLAAAERSYVAAAAADPLSPEPIDRLAELEFRMGMRDRHATGRFRRMREFSVEAIRLDPDNWLRYRVLGNRYREAFRRTHAVSDADSAIKYLAQARDRYPNNALLRAELAEAYFDIDNKPQSRRQAEQAIRLDDLNRKRGHRDRLLPAKTREALKKIVEETPKREDR